MVTDTQTSKKKTDATVTEQANTATQDQANAQQPAVSRPSDGVSGTVVGGQQKVESTAPVENQAAAQPQRKSYITEDYIKNFYQQMQNQSAEQNKYTVEQAVQQLQRAQEDAQKGFRQQQNQVNIGAAQARDAQVLYGAARGDRGGITARQYDSIANTAAQSRLNIQQQRQQLATDTARQIADLRAQGEFEQANNVLQIAQQQLAQLWELQQREDNLAAQDRQFAMSEANLTGQYNGEKTYAAQEAERAWAYDVAMQSIQLGMVPDAGVLTAAGLNPEQAKLMAYIYAQTNGTQDFIDAYNAKQGGAAGGSTGGGVSSVGGSHSSGSNKVAYDPNVDYQSKINAAVAAGDYAAAKKYEQQRNAKIDAMNKAGTNTGGYKKTDKYQDLSNVDRSSGGGGGGGDDYYEPPVTEEPVVEDTFINPTSKDNPALSDVMYQRALEGFKQTLRDNDSTVGSTLVSKAYNTLVDNFYLTDDQVKGLQDVSQMNDSALFWDHYYSSTKK